MTTEHSADRAQPDAEMPTRRGAGWRTVAVGLTLALATVVGMVGATYLLDRGDDGGTADQLEEPERGLAPVSGEESDPLPPQPLDALDGDGEIEPAAYRGRPLIVNFWATWCAPCVEEMPEFQEAHEGYDGRVAFLGVNLQDDPEAALAFAEELGITYDLAKDDGEYFAAVAGYGMPTTLLVSEDGVVRYRHTGALELDDLRELVSEHLDVEA